MSDAEPEEVPEGALSPTVTCPGCGSVFERLHLTEVCRYEAGLGYRCPNCNHILEREQET